jgi:hypothetical protein
MRKGAHASFFGGALRLVAGLAFYVLCVQIEPAGSSWWTDAVGAFLLASVLLSMGAVFVWPVLGMAMVCVSLLEALDAFLHARRKRNQTG